MSSGKKRRTHEEGILSGSVNRSVGVRLLLYLVFILIAAVLMLGNPSSYESLYGTAAFLQVALCVGLIAVFEIQHKKPPKNTRVVLMFGALSLHLLLVHLMWTLFKSSECALLTLPYALAQ